MESAKKAFEKSIYHAQKCNSKLDVVHVVTCELSGDSATIYELLDEAKIKAEKMLEEYKIEVSKNNISLDILTTQEMRKIIIDFSKI